MVPWWLPLFVWVVLLTGLVLVLNHVAPPLGVVVPLALVIIGRPRILRFRRWVERPLGLYPKRR
jgi:hypothetical protein